MKTRIINGIEVPANLSGFGFCTKYDEYEFDWDRINEAREIIRNFLKPRKFINHKYGSYGLKHIVERIMNPRIGYLPNGELIVAMIAEGFDFKTPGHGNPNCSFNVTNESAELMVEHSRKLRDAANTR